MLMTFPKEEKPLAPSLSSELSETLMAPSNISRLVWLHMVIYAMLGTRPDIAFAMGALSKYSLNHGKAHWNEAVHVLRYLGGTKTLVWSLTEIMMQIFHRSFLDIQIPTGLETWTHVGP